MFSSGGSSQRREQTVFQADSLPPEAPGKPKVTIGDGVWMWGLSGGKQVFRVEGS